VGGIPAPEIGPQAPRGMGELKTLHQLKSQKRGKGTSSSVRYSLNNEERRKKKEKKSSEEMAPSKEGEDRLRWKKPAAFYLEEN